MGTRSTIVFKANDKPVLTLYKQFDGYINGLGKEIAHFLKEVKLVNGIPYGKENELIANGIGDLALLFVKEMKEHSGNLYAIPYEKFGVESYNYQIEGKTDEFDADIIERIVVTKDGDVIFDGSLKDYIVFVGTTKTQ